MPTLVIRNVDDCLHARLKECAAAQRHSMEEEVRRERLTAAPISEPLNWVDAIRALVEPLGGIDLPDIERGTLSESPDFTGPESGAGCRSVDEGGQRRPETAHNGSLPADIQPEQRHRPSFSRFAR